MGDDGFGLLDLTHKDNENGRRYQLYGCNSTLTYCDATATEVLFRTDDLVKMNLNIPQDMGVQIELDVLKYDAETRETTTRKEWITGGRDLDLNEVAVQN
ncbi:hypothetical protein D3C87_1881820 [compost metagenome]